MCIPQTKNHMKNQSVSVSTLQYIATTKKFHFLRILEMTSIKFVSIKRETFNLLVRRDKKFCEKLIHANPLFYKERQNQCFGNIKKAYAPLWR